MRTKRMFLIIFIIAFCCAIVLSCFLLLSVGKIKFTLNVSDRITEYDIDELNQSLQKYQGKNLLLIDTQEVKNNLSKFTHFEIVSVKKSFPNVLCVEVKERREVYRIRNERKVYLLSEEGFVIEQKDYDFGEEDRNLIELKLDGVEILSLKNGQAMKTDNDLLVATAFEMAKAIDLTDCVKAMVVKNAVELNDVVFETYSGVKIVVENALDDGVIKISEAFKKYDSVATDFQKFDNNILVYKILDTGEIRAVFTDKN